MSTFQKKSNNHTASEEETSPKPRRFAQSDRPRRGAPVKRNEGGGSAERTVRGEREERSDRPDRGTRPEGGIRSERSERRENRPDPSKRNRPASGDRDRTERNGRSGRGTPVGQERRQRPGKPGRPERVERRPSSFARETVLPEERIASGHPLCKPLFVPLEPFVRKALDLLPQALDRVMALSRAHRAELPDAIRDLSALLTYERSGLGRSYWSSPRFVSAYLRYFLPWNLVRLSRLFPGLRLPDLPADDSQDIPLVVDLGSGPLTLPIALWLSRPEWRRRPLTIVCMDTVPRPMELGRQLLETLAELCGEPLVWTIRLVRAPFMRAFRELRQPPLLLMAGNVLNELKDNTSTNLEERMADLAMQVGRVLHPKGTALFVEPGTRLGGTLTARLREMALEEGLIPIAPCPHTGVCPLLERRDRRWCHASQDAGGPVWLASLAKAAHLPKDSLSLSFMQLCPETAVVEQDVPRFAEAKDAVVARILSDAFPVPGMGFARYACTEEGFAILPLAGELPSGALVACRKPTEPRKDAKTGAIELHWRTEQKH